MYAIHVFSNEAKMLHVCMSMYICMCLRVRVRVRTCSVVTVYKGGIHRNTWVETRHDGICWVGKLGACGI